MSKAKKQKLTEIYKDKTVRIAFYEAVNLVKPFVDKDADDLFLLAPHCKNLYWNNSPTIEQLKTFVVTCDWWEEQFKKAGYELEIVIDTWIDDYDETIKSEVYFKRNYSEKEIEELVEKEIEQEKLNNKKMRECKEEKERKEYERLKAKYGK